MVMVMVMVMFLRTFLKPPNRLWVCHEPTFRQASKFGASSNMEARHPNRVRRGIG